MTLYDALVAPFADYGFMRRALVACLALAFGSVPVGVFLMLRRMSLMGDAMSHAVLPGAAVGFLVAGLSPWGMGVGGLIAGLAVALAAGAVSRSTHLREDASLAGFYLASLALGVLLVSTRGNGRDLLHLLFGTILAVDDASLCLVGGIASLSLVVLAAIYRPLVLECCDPGFLRSVDGRGALWHFAFLALVVLNLVAGFQALGTLMAVGLMMLPAAAARFWVRNLAPQMLLASLLAAWASTVGLLLSYHAQLPTGPAIVLSAGVMYLPSLLCGRHDSLWRRSPTLTSGDLS